MMWKKSLSLRCFGQVRSGAMILNDGNTLDFFLKFSLEVLGNFKFSKKIEDLFKFILGKIMEIL